MSDCPPGHIRRRGYTRKNGTQVKSACVPPPAKASRRACPPGQISRKGYMRKLSTRIQSEGYTRKSKTGKVIRVYPKSKTVKVKSSCIKDVGKSGKSGNKKYCEYSNCLLVLHFGLTGRRRQGHRRRRRAWFDGLLND